MKPEHLDAAQAVCDKATPGPWIDVGWIGSADGRIVIGEGFRGEKFRTKDADFIILARTLLPQLLAENRRMREALEKIDQTVEYFAQVRGHEVTLTQLQCPSCIAEAVLKELEK